ncbi:MAG: DUF4238 domain-containing protein [Candidatus Omnitrophica bacterium]|nr:DUF4238 domain-containing protein [Candidatus Omnitrophota bacterium]
MLKQKPKKRHHYIPVFYLKGFTNKDGCLYVYDKDNKPVFESSPEAIAYENHYFSFTTPEGEMDSETVENNIMLLEGEFARTVKKIHNYEDLSVDDRIVFSLFVASMMVRIPNMRDNIRKSTSEMIKHINVFMASHKENFERMMERYEKDTGKQIGIDVEELRQWMKNPDNYDVTVDKQYSTAMALSLLEDFARVFFQMKWAFLRATDDYKYMTGDNPLQYIDPTHNPRSFYGVGLANKNIEVSLPLSKELCALGSWKYRGGYIQGTNQHVKHLNRMTVIASVRFVFADKNSEEIDKFVKKYKGSHRVMTVG